MNPHQRRQLEERLKALPKAEQDRLFKRAAELRREDQKKKRREHKRFEDIDDPRPGSGKRAGGDPVRMYVLKLLAQELAASEGTSPERERGAGDAGDADEQEARRSRSGLGVEGDDSSLAMRTGVAVQVGKRRCVVRPDVAPGGAREDVACRLPADLAGRQQTELCVGDRVAFTVPDDERREHPTVHHVLARRTVLTRRDPVSRQRQAIAANVDAVVVVVSAVSPPLHPRLIDRYLLAIEDSWVEQHTGRHADDPDPAEAVIAVNKIDLLGSLSPEERAEELAKLEPYRALGVPIVECCAGDGRGLGELRALLAGKTVVFVGHSGVGKSSLTNALDERLGIRVGAVGAAANRGRHTTTSAQLHEIPATSPGGRPFWVIDTPGIRFFGLDELTDAELRDSMPELRRLRQRCKFNDCTHTHEPGCAVKAAVEAGELHAARYETYLRLLEELEQGPKGPPAERIRPQATDPSPGDER